jgi:predicted nucleic acid-binding protein
MKYIADTTVWIEYFKQKEKVVDFIDKALDTESLAITGPIITELLQGIKSANESAMILSCIDAVPIIETSTHVWINAGLLSNELRKQGVTLPLADVLIAAIAKENDLIILTYDKHFSLIKGVSTLKI